VLRLSEAQNRILLVVGRDRRTDGGGTDVGHNTTAGAADGSTAALDADLSAGHDGRRQHHHHHHHLQQQQQQQCLWTHSGDAIVPYRRFYVRLRGDLRSSSAAQRDERLQNIIAANVTRSPAVARKSPPYRLRPKLSVRLPITQRKRILRGDTVPCTLC